MALLLLSLLLQLFPAHSCVVKHVTSVMCNVAPQIKSKWVNMHFLASMPTFEYIYVDLLI